MDSHWIRANFAKASTIMGFHGPVSINLSAPSTANSFKFVLLGKKELNNCNQCDLSFLLWLLLKPNQPNQNLPEAKHILWLAILSWVFWEKEIRKQTRNHRDNKDILFLDQPTNQPTNEPTNQEPSRHQPRTTQAPRTLSDLRAEVEGLAAAWRETEESFDTLKRWRRSSF